MAYPLPVPPAGNEPNVGSTPYQALPFTGLASLIQGIAQGAQIGHQWQHESDEMAMRREQLRNEAAYRNEIINSRDTHNADWVNAQDKRFQTMEDAINARLTPPVKPAAPTTTSLPEFIKFLGTNPALSAYFKANPGAAAAAASQASRGVFPTIPEAAMSYQAPPEATPQSNLGALWSAIKGAVGGSPAAAATVPASLKAAVAPPKKPASLKSKYLGEDQMAQNP